MPKEIRYVPIEQVPIFALRTPEKPLEVKDFYITAAIINNLQAQGKWYLVILWVMVFFVPLILAAAALDIIVFLIVKNAFVTLWAVLSDTATSLIGRFARIIGIAAAVFVVYVFVNSGEWKPCSEYLVKLFNW